MSRVNKYRGKRIDKEEWIVGFYTQLPKVSLGATIIADGDLCAEDVADYIIVNESKQHHNFSNSYLLEIVECEQYEVNPDTVGQYIGVKDKNKQGIYEKDIVLINGEDEYFVIEWDNDTARFVMNSETLTVDFDNYWGYQVEVVGNVYENPELLQNNQ